MLQRLSCCCGPVRFDPAGATRRARLATTITNGNPALANTIAIATASAADAATSVATAIFTTDTAAVAAAIIHMVPVPLATSNGSVTRAHRPPGLWLHILRFLHALRCGSHRFKSSGLRELFLL